MALCEAFARKPQPNISASVTAKRTTLRGRLVLRGGFSSRACHAESECGVGAAHLPRFPMVEPCGAYHSVGGCLNASCSSNVPCGSKSTTQRSARAKQKRFPSIPRHGGMQDQKGGPAIKLHKERDEGVNKCSGDLAIQSTWIGGTPPPPPPFRGALTENFKTHKKLHNTNKKLFNVRCCGATCKH